MTAITLVTLTGCAFLTEDEWEDGAGSVVEMSITASTEMIPEFILDDQATYAILEPKSASIKEQKILYTLKKAFSSSNRTLIDDIKKAKYVLAYSETLQRSTRVYSVPTFYSTYTNYTGFSGQSVNVTSMTTGSKTQIETNYYNVIIGANKNISQIELGNYEDFIHGIPMEK